jgi:hypothetical protein
MLDEAETPEVDAAPEGDATTENDTHGPWDEYLGEVPESIRDRVLDGMKHVEGLTTQKFQEAAEFRKQAEPYLGIDGLTKWDPSELQIGLQILDQLQDPEHGPDIVRRMAEQYGLKIADADEDDGDWDDDEGYDDDGAEPDIAELVKQHVQESTAPLTQYMQEQQRKAEEAEASRQVAESFDAIQKEAGREFDDEEKNLLFQLAQGFIGKNDDPLRAGWDAYKQITGRAQKGLVEQKRREPGQAEVGPSKPDGSFQPSTSFEDAKDEVMAYLQR